MKSVLVTGATGFIGRHSLSSLLAAGYEVHAVTIDGPRPEPPGIHWHAIDLLDARQTDELLAPLKPSHLLHFAWYAAPGKYWTAPDNVLWEQASLALLQSFSRHGGQRVVMAGTCAEYDWNYGFCSEQYTPLAPRTLYGTCKHALQLTLQAYAAQQQLSAAWGRIFFLYGPHEHPSRLVSSVIRALLQDEPALCSHGNQVRDFLHVQDVAAAFVALLDCQVTGSVNIASGQAVQLKTIIYSIADQLNRIEQVHLGALPVPADEPPFIVADARRLQTEVGWRPQYDLSTGLAQTIEWWRQQLGA
jgi:nucleoside-diphosphate-sugar epimerase